MVKNLSSFQEYPKSFVLYFEQVRLLLSLNVDSETRDKKDLNRTPLLKASRLQCEDSSEKIMRVKCRISLLNQMCCSYGKAMFLSLLVTIV